MKNRLIFIALLFISFSLQAQQVKRANDPVQEQQLTAQTKQLNQFIRRFNGEEDRNGKRLWPKDEQFRDSELRKNYIQYLFDNTNVTITKASKLRFIDQINGSSPQYLNLHKGNWFAEVKTTFEYEGVEQDLTLFLDFEAKGAGHHWVIAGIHFAPYTNRFKRPELLGAEIIHPMSHEIDFMPLHKAFQKPQNVVGYTPSDFTPDYLSLFANDVQQRRLEFKRINQVKYHFYQIENYYFQISEFIRDGLNSGWLISNLVEIEEAEKAQFIKLIRYETH